jgi:branched-chain amino acid transport system permease protein
MVWCILALAQYASHWAGILNFATISFSAVAAFGSAFIMKMTGMTIIPAILFGGILGGVTALLLSFPLLRLTSHWMALASVAVLIITRVMVLNIPSITGGVNGFLIKRTITPIHILVSLVIIAWIFSRIRRSRFGLAVETVRTDPDVASSLGINPINTKRKCLILAGIIAGVGGVIYANLVQFISPDTFVTAMAITVFASVILGGGQHWIGAIIGGLIFTILPQALRIILPKGENIVNGVILLLTMIYLPLGLVQPLLKLDLKKLFTHQLKKLRE